MPKIATTLLAALFLCACDPSQRPAPPGPVSKPKPRAEPLAAASPGEPTASPATAASPASTPAASAPTASAPATASLPDEPEVKKLREVKWKDRAYLLAAAATPFNEGEVVTVKAGKLERDAEKGKARFEVKKILYGDLSGDKAEEAAIQEQLTTPKAALGFVEVYELKNGRPARVGVIQGARAKTGFEAVALKGGKLTVKFQDPSKKDTVVTQTWTLKDGALVKDPKEKIEKK